MRTTWLLCLFLAAAASVSCGKKPEATERDAADAPAERPSDAETAKDDVGVGDVVDYAIGKKQLEAKKRVESQLEQIQADRNRRIEEALAE